MGENVFFVMKELIVLVSPFVQIQTPTVTIRNSQDCLTRAQTKTYCPYFLLRFIMTKTFQLPEKSPESFEDHTQRVPFQGS